MENLEVKVIVYGTAWCWDCKRARTFLDRNNIPYEWIDIDRDPVAREYVEKVNRGYRSVPTILFPDGRLLVEPSENQLSEWFSVN